MNALTALTFIVARLKESSTWGSLAGFFGAAATGALNAGWPQISGYCAAAAAGCGVIGFALRDVAKTTVNAKSATISAPGSTVTVDSSAVTTSPDAVLAPEKSASPAG